MKNDYKVKVNKSLAITLTQEELSTIDSIEVSKNKFHILQNNQPFQAEIISSDFSSKLYTVKLNNNTYKVKIQSELDLLIKEMGFSLGKSKTVNEIKAPMPGLILDIAVKVGQEVQENDSLLVLEAMKMENNITSPRNGIIKSININKGDAVDKGILLIEFE
jgi:biotin carboxyl carrier protein